MCPGISLTIRVKEHTIKKCQIAPRGGSSQASMACTVEAATLLLPQQYKQSVQEDGSDHRGLLRNPPARTLDFLRRCAERQNDGGQASPSQPDPRDHCLALHPLLGFVRFGSCGGGGPFYNAPPLVRSKMDIPFTGTQAHPCSPFGISAKRA